MAFINTLYNLWPNGDQKILDFGTASRVPFKRCCQSTGSTRRCWPRSDGADIPRMRGGSRRSGEPELQRRPDDAGPAVAVSTRSQSRTLCG